jgi:transposase-like protein
MILPMPWTKTRQCPFCGSHDVHRSQRYDSFEKYWLTLLLQRPYRCLSCQERHYNYAFSKRVESPAKDEEAAQKSD